MRITVALALALTAGLFLAGEATAECLVVYVYESNSELDFGTKEDERSCDWRRTDVVGGSQQGLEAKEREVRDEAGE